MARRQQGLGDVIDCLTPRTEELSYHFCLSTTQIELEAEGHDPDCEFVLPVSTFYYLGNDPVSVFGSGRETWQQALNWQLTIEEHLGDYKGISTPEPFETVMFDSKEENMKMQLGGALLFWHLSPWSALGAVAQVLSLHGYGEYVPTKLSPLTRLYHALRARYKHPYLVRGLKGVLGYEVVAEHKGPEMNSYEHVVSVKLEGTTKGSSSDDVGLEWVGAPHGSLDELYGLFVAEGDKVHGSKLSKALTDIILAHGEGLSLRGGRSPYWVHESKLSQFEALATALTPLGHELHILRHEADDRAVKAVVSAFNLEMEKALEHLAADSGGARAKRNEANRLRERLVTYETFLVKEMPELRSRIDKAEAQCVSAALGEWEDSPSLFSSVF